jgi:hypothetical protein
VTLAKSDEDERAAWKAYMGAAEDLRRYRSTLLAAGARSLVNEIDTFLRFHRDQRAQLSELLSE